MYLMQPVFTTAGRTKIQKTQPNAHSCLWTTSADSDTPIHMASRFSLPFSILDLAPVGEGSTPRQSFLNTLELAQFADRSQFHRYWLAEHHGMPGIASAATSVVMGYVAGGTNRIRVGAGGVMLPNHAPIVIAEQFGTLESLYPGRIDLGLGRAPGSDQRTARVLRRTLESSVDQFPDDVLELMNYFELPEANPVQAIPGAGLRVPFWILGSSLYGARLAADLGLPYAFASHFAPGQMREAIELYRSRFRPSKHQAKPYLMLAFNVFAAESDEAGRLLATSVQQAFVRLRTGRPGLLPPPRAGFYESLSESEQHLIDSVLSCSASGAPSTIERGLESFIAEFRPDELMITSQIFDHSARMKSYELLSKIVFSES